MDINELTAFILITVACISYINHKFIKLPNTIGLMLITMITSITLIIGGKFGFGLDEYAQKIISSIDFNATLMHGMLGFLLFAGALHVNLDELIDKKWTIFTLATFSVLISTIIIGYIFYYVVQFFGFNIPLIPCLIFGALISPTDPISVLAIMKKIGVQKSIEIKICGESLFNDGVGVVVFITLLELITSGHTPTIGSVGGTFFKEAGGGIIFGLIIGSVAYQMLKSIDDYAVEILITLALVYGGYTFASWMHISGPIAMVAAGLLIGNHGRRLAMSENTRNRLDDFWELIDEILNATLFVLVGLEVFVINRNSTFLLISLVTIFIALIARSLSIGFPIAVLNLFKQNISFKTYKLLVWGGLRGGISVALALSLPTDFPSRDLIITASYSIVAFSIIIQGLTVKYFVPKIEKIKTTFK